MDWLIYFNPRTTSQIDGDLISSPSSFSFLLLHQFTTNSTSVIEVNFLFSDIPRGVHCAQQNKALLVLMSTDESVPVGLSLQ